jgi:arginyl-tRNA synthetase
MQTLQFIIEKRASEAIEKAFSSRLTKEDLQAEVVPCQREDFGHYQCNSSLKIAKILGENPQIIAEEILKNFDGKPIVQKMEIAKMGFLNFWIDPIFLSKDLDTMLRDNWLGIERPIKKEKIIVEFSSPNIAKELHVGHLRSTIIGDSLARLFEFLGHDVLRLNHIGDWGTQFGMLIAYLKKFSPGVLNGEEETDLSHLMEWYKASKKLFDQDPLFKKESQRQVVQLQGGDKDALQAWEMICEISRRAFQEIYDLLDVQIVERGESFYNPFLKEIVEDLERKKLITISDGAKCIFLEGFQNREGKPMPIIVQKSDGGFNYDTTELAAFRHRTWEEKADRIIVVTASEQTLHFKMIEQAAILAGYLDLKKTRFDHVTFGLVLGMKGKKIKTREGEAEKLLDLLHEAMDHAKSILLERISVIEKEELEEMAKALGIGAVKYADLSTLRSKDYTFSYEKMLKFEGNTSAFLLYAYVRIIGIKRKTKADVESVAQISHIDLQHPSEIALGLHLRRFHEVLQTMAVTLLPNRLADYLYSLAEKFNAFFRDCRVEGTPEENQRLLLCELSARILKEGLSILGLKTISRM